ncbi:hypothetical protein Tco_0695271 [Tanacetum coccineum]
MEEIRLKMNLPDHRIKQKWRWRHLVPVESIHHPMLTLNASNCSLSESLQRLKNSYTRSPAARIKLILLAIWSIYSTGASGSKTTSNTKNNRISQQSSATRKIKVIGNVTISRVYYVVRDSDTIYSLLGNFNDSDLEVAFRKHTCFVRNLEVLDLLTSVPRNYCIKLFIGDMMKSSHYLSLVKGLLRLSRKAHLLEDKQIPSVGVFDEVFSTWMEFGGNTRNLGSFGEETDKITNLHQIHEEILFTDGRDDVAGIKRRRRDLSSDGVRDLAMVSGRG